MRSIFVRPLMMISVLLGSIAAIGAVAPAALAAPGTPQAPKVLYTENFENTSSSVLLSSYTGVSGETYTADPTWISASQCNGIITNGSSTTGGYSGCPANSQIEQLATDLGSLNGTGSANHALSAYTYTQFTATNGVEFATASPIPLVVSNRFLSFSVDAAAINCQLQGPEYEFYLTSGASQYPTFTSPIDPCTDPRGQSIGTNAFVGHYPSTGSVLFSGANLGIKLVNANNAWDGNDAAIDNVEVLDVTPQLSKSFSQSPQSTDQPVTLTFTITNTSELGQKDGWSFTDDLPSGLVVANPANASTSCSNTTVQASAGSSSIAVPSGDLNQGQAYCTVSVSVASSSSAPGSYANGAGNVSTVGLNPPATATVQFTGDPRVSMVKHANVSPATDQAAAKLGDSIAYSYTVTNTGNVPLGSVAINDPSAGAVSCPALPAGGLPVGAAVTCTATASHTVSSNDIENGQIVDTATASGTDIYGEGTPTSAPSTVSVATAEPHPAVAVQKLGTVTPTADQNGVRVGDSIQYSYLVTNTGNVNLKTVAVNDPSAGTVNCPVPAYPGLAPGGSLTCTAVTTHTVTQTDVDGGEVLDTATATGVDSKGHSTPTSNPATATVIAATPAPALSLTKIANASGGDTNPITVGETIQYSYHVTNTGNVTLTHVSVSDPTGGPVSCPLGTLAPGGAETCTEDTPYTVTQTDVNNGGVTDTATATATPPSTHPPGTNPTPIPTSLPSQTTVPGQPAPSVAMQKVGTVSPAVDQGGLGLGDQVAYSYIVTNTGNVDLTTVGVSDPSIGAVSCPAPSGLGLAPGKSETCTAANRYTVTQADIDRGSVSDTATATGADASGAVSARSPQSEVTLLTSPAAPLLKIVKAAHVFPSRDQKRARVGNRISYTYTVTNIGNVDLPSVAVSDPSIGRVSCPTPGAPGLAVGASLTCRSARAHVVSKKDAKAGRVIDVATAEGVDPRGQTSAVSAPGRATTPVQRIRIRHRRRRRPPRGRLTLRKTASARVVQGGHDVTYTLTLRNPTKVVVRHITVCDALPAGLNFVRAMPFARLHGERRCWNIKVLGKHRTRRLLITANVSLTHGGRVTNHATASAKGIRTVHATTTIRVTRVAISPCVVGRSAAAGPSRHGDPTATMAC